MKTTHQAVTGALRKDGHKAARGVGLYPTRSGYKAVSELDGSVHVWHFGIVSSPGSGQRAFDAYTETLERAGFHVRRGFAYLTVTKEDSK